MLPYPISEDSPNNYRFITDLGNEYTLNFVRYWQQDLIDLYSSIDIDVYEFYFEIFMRRKSGLDNRIPFTIFNILERFLKVNKSILFFVTQREDGRGKELFRVYQLWANLYYRSYYQETLIQKVDRSIWYGDFAEAYLSCLYLKNDYVDSKFLENLLNELLYEIYPNCRVIDG